MGNVTIMVRDESSSAVVNQTLQVGQESLKENPSWRGQVLKAEQQSGGV